MIQDNASSQPTQIQAPTREDLKTGHTPLNNNGMVSVDKSRWLNTIYNNNLVQTLILS